MGIIHGSVILWETPFLSSSTQHRNFIVSLAPDPQVHSHPNNNRDQDRPVKDFSIAPDVFTAFLVLNKARLDKIEQQPDNNRNHRSSD